MANQDDTYKSALRQYLSVSYDPETVTALIARIVPLVDAARAKVDHGVARWLDERDVMLITYGDSVRASGEAPLATLRRFLAAHTADVITNVHILPFYPWTSDDGFSVTDYRAIDPALGDWSDVAALAEDVGLMFDGVINHISAESAWFEAFLAGDADYADFFTVMDPATDLSQVTRPRATPVLTAFETAHGTRHVWTTFSADQIDLDYANPDVLVEILDLLITYAKKGARFIRLDAIGFLWKEVGTTCMHLPQTHAVIKAMRTVLDAAVPGTLIVTETNVPHADNISYFGNGSDEAQLVYQFPLPPLTLHAFLTGDASRLTGWAASLEPTTPSTTFFNFLASHDGIGVRPAEGILTAEEVGAMADAVVARGGRVSMRSLPGGGEAPYELNITYLDALSAPGEDEATSLAKFMAAQTILLSVVGIPGIYIHSLLGSHNDVAGLERTGRARSINREKLDLARLEADLADPSSLRARVLEAFRQRLVLRASRPAFAPNARQRVLSLDERVFTLVREGEGDRVWVAVNVCDAPVTISAAATELGLAPGPLHSLLGGAAPTREGAAVTLTLAPYEAAWIAA
ncbi:alpha-amylase family glycosyl hydrolase [Acuticoccus sp. I52.16.1]|uniref:alpha-amylase family glycosyl hydrolase n=1 Tax=Acuticoccus sp. I52.16.1 TaxID=2928472 RepID=UPI001FD3BF8E|nr:alpha-amylase family glycosyl hydrolase [Acuticoccus sp. I52.16.1]UOM34883.1 alpha-amylase family glycosyl hydrolase [Acuticoccus sp. I52.16.1]